MATETMNQEQDTQQQNNQQEKTFTADQVNAIVAERLSRERAKYPDYDALKAKAKKYDAQEEAQKTELQKATDKAASLQKELDAMKDAEKIRSVREKVSKDTGVPAELLSGTDEDSCKAQAEAIKKYAGEKAYPEVRDGGRTQQNVKPESAAVEFASWFNKSLNQ